MECQIGMASDEIRHRERASERIHPLSESEVVLTPSDIPTFRSQSRSSFWLNKSPTGAFASSLGHSLARHICPDSTPRNCLILLSFTAQLSPI